MSRYETLSQLELNKKLLEQLQKKEDLKQKKDFIMTMSKNDTARQNTMDCINDRIDYIKRYIKPEIDEDLEYEIIRDQAHNEAMYMRDDEDLDNMID